MIYEVYARGRAGKSLLKSLSPRGRWLGEGEGPADILFLTVPDKAVAEVAAELKPPYPRCVAHLSGAHSYNLLQALEGKCALAQFHPLAALTGDHPIPPGTLCAISSNEPWAEQALIDLTVSMNLKPVAIPADKTTHYHAAAVLTGNLSLGLVQESIKLMQEAGIDTETARIALARLLASVAKNLEEKDLCEALTGPIARRDFYTIEQHLNVLPEEIRAIYEVLSGRLMISHLLNHQEPHLD